MSAALNSNDQARVEELLKQSCVCVTCRDCGGRGYYDLSWDDVIGDEETCYTCNGRGIVEECERCLEIEAIENLHL